MKKLFATLMIAVFLLAGCATSTASTNPCEGSDPVIGLVTDTGGINDESFNQGAWEGIQQYCEEASVSATYVETQSDADIAANLETMAANPTVEVIVLPGYKFAQPLATVAPKYPDKDFIIIDSEPVDDTWTPVQLDNVHSYLFKEQEAGYLVGYIAAKKTQTGNIGFIGGEPVPAVQKFGYGFVAGANAADPSVTVQYAYSDTFNDQVVTKGIADTQIKNGADIIFTAAGGANKGVVQATIDATLAGTPTWTIGVDSDMYNSGLYTDADGNEQSVILTSAIKGVHLAAYEGTKAHFEGTFTGGTDTLGYAEGGVGLPETNPNLSEDQAIIDEAIASLEGATVPSTLEETQALNANVEGLK